MTRDPQTEAALRSGRIVAHGGYLINEQIPGADYRRLHMQREGQFTGPVMVAIFNVDADGYPLDNVKPTVTTTAGSGTMYEADRENAEVTARDFLESYEPRRTVTEFPSIRRRRSAVAALG